MSADKESLPFDPLIDLPVGIAEWPVVEKMTALVQTYQKEVRLGRRGLELIINDSPQGSEDWRLYGQTWNWLRSIDQHSSIQELAVNAQIGYRWREQQIAWALEALGFEPQEFLEYLARDHEHQDDPQQPEIALSWELFKRHGPCPDHFDPSHRGYAQAAGRNRQQRLQLLADLYQDVLAQVSCWQQQAAENPTGAISADKLRRAKELEGQFFWTAEHLDLDPGWALQRLQCPTPQN